MASCHPLKKEKVMFMKTVLTMLFTIFVAPAMAQSIFPDFDYQKECEKLGQPPLSNPKTDDITMRVNNCLDGEASYRKSAEYKWKPASENVRAEAMAHVDYIRRNYCGVYSSCPFYGYLDGSLSVFSEKEANDEANKRLHEKRPGIHY
jgi:hypothetical protein